MDKFTDGYETLTLVEQLRADVKSYIDSISAPDTDDMFTLAYQWQDKKHRHVYDLCYQLNKAADAIERLSGYAEHTMFCKWWTWEEDSPVESCTCGLSKITGEI